MDLDALQTALSTGEPHAVQTIPGLKETWASPGEFWHVLFSPKPGEPVCKSVPFSAYDFFADAVLRHTDSMFPAFSSYDLVSGWQHLTYAELAERSAVLAATWLANGLGPGSTVTICVPFGQDLVVLLCAALKLGLVVSWVPMEGPTYINNRCELLASDAVVTTQMYARSLAGVENLLSCDLHSEAAEEAVSHSYGPEDIVFRVVDPVLTPSEQPTEVAANAAFLVPYRDGRFVFGIRPGTAMCLPGFHGPQFHPPALLATLLHGGTYIELNQDALVDQIDHLNQQRRLVLGVSRRFRDQLVSARPSLTSCSLWFRDGFEMADFALWQQFAEKCNMQNVPSTCVCSSAAHGGVLLMALKRTGNVLPFMIPAPGVPWELTAWSGEAQQALTDYGLFSPGPPVVCDERTGFMLLGVHGAEYVMAGTLPRRREGRIYPGLEVLELVQSGTDVHAATIVEAADGTVIPKYALLVFQTTPMESDEEAGQKQELLDQIRKELGPDAMPDRIEFYPFAPPMEEDEVDQVECAMFYESGIFRQKKESTFFSHLADLRRQLT